MLGASDEGYKIGYEKGLEDATNKGNVVKISVLNHGSIGLVNWMGKDIDIERAARVSYGGHEAERTPDERRKLINYLMKNDHTSPFEACVLTFHIKAPIFVFRQWHRHRTWSYNEISARYKELPEEFYIPRIQDITTQSNDNKQMRTEEQNEAANRIQYIIMQRCKYSFEAYHEMLDLGCPRELARGVLPVNTYSEMYATVDLHNLFHFLKLRCHEHAQYEIRVYAEAILTILTEHLPMATEAFMRKLGRIT